MAKTCPSCNKELNDSEKKASAWLPILTAVGVSAAAIYVLRKVRKSAPEAHVDKNLLEECTRAARALDSRIGEETIRLAG